LGNPVYLQELWVILKRKLLTISKQTASLVKRNSKYEAYFEATLFCKKEFLNAGTNCQ
jgi:hypothetical protein